MEKSKHYRFSAGANTYIVFDKNGYIVDAKGFDLLMWSYTLDADQEIIGKHVNGLSDMLEKYALTKDVCLQFEKRVHVKLLEEMLQNQKS